MTRTLPLLLLLAAPLLAQRPVTVTLADPLGDLKGAKVTFNGEDRTDKFPVTVDVPPGGLVQRTLQIERNGRIFDRRILNLRPGWDVAVPVIDFANGRPELVPQTGHTDFPLAMVASRDGRRLLTVGADRVGIVWDAATGRQQRILSGAQNMVLAADMDAAGRVAVLGVGQLDDTYSAAGGGLRVVNVETGALIHKVNSPPISAVAMDPQAQVVWLATRTGSLYAWPFAKDGEIELVAKDQGVIEAISFSRDGKVVATGGDRGEFRRYDAATRKPFEAVGINRNADGRVTPVKSFASTPDGSAFLVAWQENPAALLINAATGAVIQRYATGGTGLHNASISPDGRTAVIATWTMLPAAPNAPAGQLNRVVSFDLVKGVKQREFVSSRAEVRVGAVVARTGGGQTLYLLERKNSIAALDLATGVKRVSLDNHLDRTYTLAFRPDGNVLVASVDHGIIARWDPADDPPVRVSRPHTNFVRSIHYRKDGKVYATGAGDGNAALWHDDGRLIHRFNVQAPNANTVKLTPDGRKLVVATKAEGGVPGKLMVFDVAAKAIVAGPMNHPTSVWDIDISPDGTTLALCDGENEHNRRVPGKVELLDLNLKQIRTLTVPTKEMLACVRFSPDGRRLAVSHFDGRTVIWDCKSGAKITECGTLGGPRAMTSSWLPDGEAVLVALADNTIALYAAKSGAKLATFTGHTGPVDLAVLRPGTLGRNFASIGGDGVLRYWDAALGDQIAWLSTVQDGRDWLAATPAGRFDGTQGGRSAIAFRTDSKLNVALADRFYRDFHSEGFLKDLWAGKAVAPPAKITDSEPPVVRIVTAAPTEPLPGDKFSFDVEVTDRGSGIEKVIVKLGDMLLSPARDFPGTNKAVIFRFDVPQLPDGEVVITATAQGKKAGAREAEPAALRFNYAAQDKKRRLHVVAIGVNNSPAGQELAFPENDAEEFAKLFKTHMHPEFSDVNTTVLSGVTATTPRIKATLDNLKTGANDMLLLYLSGHGKTTAGLNSDYYFLTSNARAADLQNTALAGQDIFRLVNKEQLRNAFIILDTCEASGFLPSIHRKMDNQRRLNLDHSVLYASMSAKNAIENLRMRHGLLTYGLLYSAGVERINNFDDPSLPRLRTGEAWTHREWADKAIRVSEWVLDEKLNKGNDKLISVPGSNINRAFPLIKSK
jgi:WD40 repeat protein